MKVLEAGVGEHFLFINRPTATRLVIGGYSAADKIRVPTRVELDGFEICFAIEQHDVGTLYNAAFYPQRNACEYFWPENNWQFNFQNFSARDYHMAFIDPEGYPAKSRAYGEIYTSQPLPVLQF